MAKKIIEIIKNSGAFAPIVYAVVQFLQVTFIPINSTPVTVAGSLLFDWWLCLILTLVGQIGGSVLAFWIGRKFGLKAVYKFAKPQTVEKWRGKMKGREKTTLLFMFVLPVFPDDLLCLLAGLTDMRYSTFFGVQVLSRTMAALWTIFGTKLVALLAKLGIQWYWWLSIGVAAGVAMTVIVVYQDKISEWFLKIFNKKREVKMELKKMKLSDIKPYGKNPRKNDGAVDAVANSIKEFGFKVPIIIDKDGVIVAGHTRYKASQKLGLTEVPCIVADDLDEKQIQAFRIAENKTNDLAEWNKDLLADELKDIIGDFDMTNFGFGDFEISMLINDMEPEKFDDNLIEEYSQNSDNFLKAKRVIITYQTDEEEAFVKKLLHEENDLRVCYRAEDLLGDESNSD